MQIEFIPVKTRIVMPPADPIWDIIDGLDVRDGDIVFITSKILAIHQGRCIKQGSTSKQKLIEQESTHFLPYRHPDGFDISLAIVNNTLMPAAGIDESNADGHYILLPERIDELCKEIRSRLIKKHKVKNLGIVCTDSHTTPLRWGVTGITMGLSGVNQLNDIRGSKDIFGRTMHVTKVNLVDPLTSMAVLIMGECAEQTPVVILRNYKGIPFDANGSMKDFKICSETDIYKPLLDVFKKKT
ncbi:MAG: coenzyme F420-0:L-glutamate ligase [Christensenellaceae bacterium]|jgi:F420-0:gamma-glutamyl ligase|nr:coenzyme F420-0:L-glutamate ligase [Christensenellaceae bacterium]